MKITRQQFEALPAQEQWLWVITNKEDISLLIELDNDCTYVTSDYFKVGEDNGSVTMKSYLGISEGLFHLVKSIGIECTGV